MDEVIETDLDNSGRFLAVFRNVKSNKRQMDRLRGHSPTSCMYLLENASMEVCNTAIAAVLPCCLATDFP